MYLLGNRRRWFLGSLLCMYSGAVARQSYMLFGGCCVVVRVLLLLGDPKGLLMCYYVVVRVLLCSCKEILGGC